MERGIEAVAADIVDAAFKVHKAFGPGLLESAYQQCHAYELRKRGRKVLTEVAVPLDYDGQHIDAGFRLDMLVDDLIIIEHKTVDAVLPIHLAQLMTYLKLKDCRLGFLINWNVKLIKNGITRVANGVPEPAPPLKPFRESWRSKRALRFDFNCPIAAARASPYLRVLAVHIAVKSTHG